MRRGGIETLVFNMVLDNPFDNKILVLEGEREDLIKGWPLLEKIKSNLIFLNKKPKFDLSAGLKIKKILIQERIEVIHSHHIGPLVYSSLALMFSCKYNHVHSEHDVWHLSKKKDYFIQKILFCLFKKIKVVAVSLEVKKTLEMNFTSKSFELIYNGVDVKKFKPLDRNKARQLFDLPLNKKILLSVGRVEHVKGHEYLISSLSYLKEDFIVVIAGNGSCLENLKKLTKKLDLNNRVIFLGSIDNPEHLYPASDIFCLPSLNEGLPFALLEAQACNIPVLCSDVGGCYEAINIESGSLVEAANSKLIAKEVIKLIEMKLHPRNYIIKNFSFESLLIKYDSLYGDFK